MDIVCGGRVEKRKLVWIRDVGFLHVIDKDSLPSASPCQPAELAEDAKSGMPDMMTGWSQ